MTDWRPAIVRMVEIKQAIYEADTDGLWEYHLPRVAATEDEIAAVEARLGIRLDPQYREFLRYANGWPSFYQSVDLFGTEDLAGGPRMRYANELLDVIEPEPVLQQAGLDRGALLPIAVTTEDRDMFVMPVADGQQVPPVVWLAPEETDRFPSFEDYYLAMIEYNTLELADLKKESAEP